MAASGHLLPLSRCLRHSRHPLLQERLRILTLLCSMDALVTGEGGSLSDAGGSKDDLDFTIVGFECEGEECVRRGLCANDFGGCWWPRWWLWSDFLKSFFGFLWN